MRGNSKRVLGFFLPAPGAQCGTAPCAGSSCRAECCPSWAALLHRPGCCHHTLLPISCTPGCGAALLSLVRSCWHVAQSCCPTLPQTWGQPTGSPTACCPPSSWQPGSCPWSPVPSLQSGLPNRCLPRHRDEDEVYDDVESVGVLRRGQDFLVPPVSRPPAYPRPGGGGYRRGWDAGWGSAAAQRALRPR